MSPTLTVLFGFLLLQLLLGAWIARRVRGLDDFLVAGRKLGYPLAGASIFATWFGAETVIGSAGRAYEQGISLRHAEPFGYGLCLILMGAVFARPLWARRLTTLADLFRQRFSSGTERTAALLLIPTSLFWAAAQVRAFGQLLSGAGLGSVEMGIWVAALLAIAYTSLGGLLADAVTDLLQGSVVIVGLLVLALAGWWTVSALEGNLGEPAGTAAVTEEPSAEGNLLAFVEEWAIPICGSVLAAELVARVIAARSAAVASRAALGAGGLYLAFGLIPLGLGVWGSRLIPGLEDGEQVVPQLAQLLLPGWGQAIFAAALSAAILSTVDSTLLVASGLAVQNLLPSNAGDRSSRPRLVLVRASVVLFGVTAAWLATRSTGVLDLVEQASALGSSGVLVCAVLGLFTHWGGAPAALAALLSGMGVYLAGVALGWPYPYLSSLLAALLAYGATALLEGFRARSEGRTWTTRSHV